MGGTPYQTIECANACLAALLANARGALRGECLFNTESIQQFRQPIEEMSAIVDQSKVLRSEQPELNGPLDVYKTRLAELQTTLHQIRVMLLAQQTNLSACQTQVSAVSQWITAFHQTR